MRRAAPVAAAVLAVACATAPPPARPPAAPPTAPPRAAAGPHSEPEVIGIVHVVRRGETVYRIARTYGIDPTDLMETNGIDDPRAVEIGTELFVPGAARVLAVPAPAALPPAQAPGGGPRDPEPSPGTTGTATAAQSPTPAPAPTATRASTSPPRRDAPAPDGAALSWPLRGVLYGRFGWRGGQRHDGIDIAAPEGTAVVAAADGTVIFAGRQEGYGSIVILRHAGGLVTLYAHASALLVKRGQQVERGTPVARVGQTGKTTGPHLHFEVRQGTRPRDPLLFLR
jgi:murein DD-endopeptidase MepM/ murein hydrolase activator NlpD